VNCSELRALNCERAGAGLDYSFGNQLQEAFVMDGDNLVGHARLFGAM
jgi:hypothetical protein